jgi:LysM repeat protein
MKQSSNKIQKIVILFFILILFCFLSFTNFIIDIKTYSKNSDDNITKNIFFYQPIIQRQENPKVLLTISDNTTYKVQKGDTLYGIAKKYNISVEELRKANNLKESDTLKIGMILNIHSKSLVIYSPVDNFELKLKTEKILLLYLKSSIIFSPVANGEIIYVGDISGFGKSVIVKIEDYSIVISNFQDIFVQNGQKVNLQTCIGYSPQDNVLNLSVFFKEKMLSLKDFFKK